MKNTKFLVWAKAALIRAIKTTAQTAVGMFTVGAAMNEINWQYVLSVALVAGILSILTSLAGLPEVGSDGTLKIDSTTNPTKDMMLLELNIPTDTISSKKKITLSIDPSADLSQK